MKPLCIDLFCGLGGWAEGFLSEGYDVIGFDIERHDYGTGGYPGHLVLRDVLTLRGKLFTRASVIVASPPCQEFSYMAMPWSRGKQIARALRGTDEFPDKYTGSRTMEKLTQLFWSCFRIAEEAGVPLVVENVKGAEAWVGPAKARFGSFYFWGDIGSVGGAVAGPVPRFGELIRARRGGKAKTNFHFFENTGLPSPSFHGAEHEPSVMRAAEMTGRKGPGGDWFEDGRQGQDACIQGIKASGLNWNGHGEPGYKPQGFNVTNAQRFRDGLKLPEGHDTFHVTGLPCNRLTDPRYGSGIKGIRSSHPNGGKSDLGGPHDPRRFGSCSDSRKAASAQIAKIPFPLAQHIARCFKP